MARLPSEKYLIQQVEGEVVLFHANTNTEIGRFNPHDGPATAQFQKVIYDSNLSDEDKSFAHFWCGYFFAHATHNNNNNNDGEF